MMGFQPLHRRSHGFSMLELLVVVAITVTIAALVLPSITNSIYNMRLRAAANDVTGLLQQARFRAIRDNTYYPVCYFSTATTKLFYVDLTTSHNCSAGYSGASFADVHGNTVTYPTVQLGGNITAPTSGNPSITTMALGATPLLTAPYFSVRGTPCVVSGSVCANTAAPWYQIFLTDSRPSGPNGWASITISPAGRTRVWIWTGTKWQ